jgi:hypothetical protein
MPTIQIELDIQTFNKLAEIAVQECRPIPWQAEILLERVLANCSDTPVRDRPDEEPGHAQG